MRGLGDSERKPSPFRADSGMLLSIVTPLGGTVMHLHSLSLSLSLPTKLFQPGDWDKVEEIKVATPAGAECRRCILPPIVCSSCYAPPAPSSCSSHGCSCSPSNSSPPAAEACNCSRQQAHGTAAAPPHPEEKKPVKSNLKKAPPAAVAAQEEKNRVSLVVSRKVTWPDAQGKDLAHVLEFHPR
ncbi:hypothetical protein OsJ_23990 [Oryza sativa Japonica Group]|uniref:Uncharacterized protein n=1 Tax=Oryza sativa subsp. japonica TaxID=39947 RepID=B9FWW0_ORYSJ|nr:hypothetical protein OsJ_23990 [Oryza sativa Japonica Group]